MRCINDDMIRKAIDMLATLWAVEAPRRLLWYMKDIRNIIYRSELPYGKNYNVISIRLIRAEVLLEKGNSQAASDIIHSLKERMRKPLHVARMSHSEKQRQVVDLYLFYLAKRFDRLVDEAREAARFARAFNDPFFFWMEKLANEMEQGYHQEGLVMLRDLQIMLGLHEDTNTGP